MTEVITILADGFEETEAVTFIDLLRRAEIQVTIAGLNSLQVTGSHGITISADIKLQDFKKITDGIVLPGGMPGTKHLRESPEVIELVRTYYNSKKLCAAICAAPSVLGIAGILKGHKATCFPGVESHLHDATFIPNSKVVHDQNIITSKGVGTAIDFSLAIIRYFLNDSIANQISKTIQYS